MKLFLTSILCTLALTFNSCGMKKTTDNIENTNNNSIHDIYVVKSVTDIANDGIVITPSKQIDLELNTTKMKVMGHDGCNRFFGDIKELKNNQLTFGLLASTKMFCPEIEPTAYFYSAMSSVQSYKRKELIIMLLDKDGNKVVELLKVD